MTTQTSTDIAARIDALNDYIAQGKILEALEEFYAENVSMQENLNEPCVGRAANVEREKAWLDTVEQFTGFEVKAVAVSGDTSFIETSMGYRSKDGQDVHLEQVSRARWNDGRIVDERFYHG